jgi:hypothetical protein
VVIENDSASDIIKQELNRILFKTGTFVYAETARVVMYGMRNDTLSVVINNLRNEQIVSVTTSINDFIRILSYKSHERICPVKVSKSELKIIKPSTEHDAYFFEV